MKFQWEVYVDGACSGNPGEASVGVVFFKDSQIFQEIGKPIGQATNNIAEYSALICALKEARQLDITDLKIYTDSELMYQQMIGRYKVKNDKLKTLFEEAKQLVSNFKNIQIEHVLREKNKDADRVASEVLKQKQAKMVAPTFFDLKSEKA